LSNIKILIFSLVFGSFLFACSTIENDPIELPTDSGLIEHGKILVKGLAACGFCHGDSNAFNSEEPNSVLSGGKMLYDRYGEIQAPNLTSSDTGLGGWEALDFIKLFRSYTTRSERRISQDIHKGFDWLSDKDIFAISAYLRTLPPIDNDVPKRSVGFIDRNVSGFTDVDKEVSGHVPEIEKNYTYERGEYLVNNVARCAACHDSEGTLIDSERSFAGGRIIKNSFGEKLVPNITSAEQVGIGSWAEDEIIEYLKTGVGPGNKASDPNFCPTGYYRNAAPEDLIAVAKYIKSIPAVN
jgi:cytochrome c553